MSSPHDREALLELHAAVAARACQPGAGADLDRRLAEVLDALLDPEEAEPCVDPWQPAACEVDEGFWRRVRRPSGCCGPAKERRQDEGEAATGPLWTVDGGTSIFGVTVTTASQSPILAGGASVATRASDDELADLRNRLGTTIAETRQARAMGIEGLDVDLSRSGQGFGDGRATVLLDAGGGVAWAADLTNHAVRAPEGAGLDHGTAPRQGLGPDYSDRGEPR